MSAHARNARATNQLDNFLANLPISPPKSGKYLSVVVVGHSVSSCAVAVSGELEPATVGSGWGRAAGQERETTTTGDDGDEDDEDDGCTVAVRGL